MNLRNLLAVSATLAAAGCGVSEELYNARVAELAKAKADLDAERKARSKAHQTLADLERQNAALKQRLTSLGQNIMELEGDKNTLASDLDSARKRMEELKKAQEQAEARTAQFRQLLAKLKGMIDSGKLKVEIRNGLMLVKLPDHILFDPGQTALKSEGQEAIKEVAGILAQLPPDRKFQVAGHTDNKGLSRSSKYKDNWELSAARAVEVLHYMVDKGGMPKERVSAAGFADQLPVASNDTDEGRKANRRIEIVLVPNISELPAMDDVLPKS
jgi:chemotaxis protein MotB